MLLLCHELQVKDHYAVNPRFDVLNGVQFLLSHVVCEAESRLQVCHKVRAETFIRDVLEGSGCIQFIVGFADRHRPFVEFSFSLWGDEFLNEFILPVTR
jgi:hypothetical protein